MTISDLDGDVAAVHLLPDKTRALTARITRFLAAADNFEPTPDELPTLERDKRAVMAINAAIEGQDAARRPLTRADTQAQIESIMRQEQEATCRS